MIVIRDQQLRLLVLAQLIRELQQGAGEDAPPPPGFTERAARGVAVASAPRSS